MHLRDNDFVSCYYFQVMSFPQIVNCVIGNKVIQQVGVLTICLVTLSDKSHFIRTRAKNGSKVKKNKLRIIGGSASKIKKK